MVDYLEILRLSSDPKNSQRCIASIVHCSRHTIRAVLEAAKKAGLSWRKRQTSPRIKGRHLQECCFSLRWRSSIIAAYSILSGHLREAAFQSMLHQLRSVAAHFAGSKADIGTGPGRSPSPFPSGCRSRRWPVRHRVCWQRASSSCPSQRA